MNNLLDPFVNEINKISKGLLLNLEILLKKDLYENFKHSIEENIVEKVEKEM